MPGGNGAQTNDGIRVIEVGGNSAGSFSLLGDYVHQGEQAIVAGAYAYKLYQGGKATPNDGDWYLRSELVTPAAVRPLYQPGVPSYEAYPQALLALNALPTWQQRVGGRFTAGHGGASAGTDAGRSMAPEAIWLRLAGARSVLFPRLSTSATDYDQNRFELQAGMDMDLGGNARGDLVGGIFARYASGETMVRSVYGDGMIATSGFGLGGTLTWHDEGGFYVDAQGQLGWYSSDLRAGAAGRRLAGGNDGLGYAFSLEAGQNFRLGGKWSLSPQAQLAYSGIRFDRFTDVFGASVSLGHGDSLKGRIGLALEYGGDDPTDAASATGRARFHGVVNIYNEFLDPTSVSVSGTRFNSGNDRLWGELGLGGSYEWAGGRYSLFGQGSIATSLENFGRSHSYQGRIGFRVRL